MQVFLMRRRQTFQDIHQTFRAGKSCAELTHNTGFMGLRIESSERSGKSGKEVLHVFQLSIGHFMQPLREEQQKEDM